MQRKIKHTKKKKKKKRHQDPLFSPPATKIIQYFSEHSVTSSTVFCPIFLFSCYFLDVKVYLFVKQKTRNVLKSELHYDDIPLFHLSPNFFLGSVLVYRFYISISCSFLQLCSLSPSLCLSIFEWLPLFLHLLSCLYRFLVCAFLLT